ncbi:unnamed protein product, partial [Amoebophrya sp. A25]
PKWLRAIYNSLDASKLLDQCDHFALGREAIQEAELLSGKSTSLHSDCLKNVSRLGVHSSRYVRDLQELGFQAKKQHPLPLDAQSKEARRVLVEADEKGRAPVQNQSSTAVLERHPRRAQSMARGRGPHQIMTSRGQGEGNYNIYSHAPFDIEQTSASLKRKRIQVGGEQDQDVAAEDKMQRTIGEGSSSATTSAGGRHHAQHGSSPQQRRTRSPGASMRTVCISRNECMMNRYTLNAATQRCLVLSRLVTMVYTTGRDRDSCGALEDSSESKTNKGSGSATTLSSWTSNPP